MFNLQIEVSKQQYDDPSFMERIATFLREDQRRLEESARAHEHKVASLLKLNSKPLHIVCLDKDGKELSRCVGMYSTSTDKLRSLTLAEITQWIFEAKKNGPPTSTYQIEDQP